MLVIMTILDLLKTSFVSSKKPVQGWVKKKLLWNFIMTYCQIFMS